MSERLINADQTAEKLGMSPRSLERRHTWTPPFPAPVRRKPLLWREESIDEWIVKAARLAA